MEKSLEDKLKKINDLQETIKDAQKKLEALLYPEKSVVLPSDFSMNAEVLTIIKESGDGGIEIKHLLKTMQDKFSKYGIDRRKLASSLAYLKNGKKVITSVGHGRYKAL
jgi:hypothetical protein